MGGVVSDVYLLGSWGFSHVDVVVGYLGGSCHVDVGYLGGSCQVDVGYFEGSSGLTQLEVEVVQVVDEDE